MAIGLTPLAAANWNLDANDYYGDLANLIATTLPADTINAASWRHQLLAFLMKGQMPDGGGFTYAIQTKLLPGEDVDFMNGNDQLNIYRGDFKQVPIKVMKTRRYSITNNTNVTRQAFATGNMIDHILNVVWKQPEQAAIMEWSEYGLNLLDKSVCTKININMSAPTTGGADGYADRITAQQQLVQQIQKACGDVTVYSAKYTNQVTMQERHPDELTFVFNMKYLWKMMTEIIAPLFNGEAIMELSQITQAVLLPEAACTQPDLVKDPTGATPKYPTLAKMICLVTTWERFNLFYSYIDSGVFKLPIIGSETLTRIVSGGWGEVDDFFAVMFLDQ